MFVAGIDAHTTYSVVVVVSNTGDLVHQPTRIPNAEPDRLLRLLEEFRPLEAVVETCPSWPWLFDLFQGSGIHFVLAHAKRLRAIADSTYKRDDLDAELLARMRLAGLIPEVYPKSVEQREQAALLRNRAMLVRQRTAAAARIHSQLHQVGLHMARGHLLTRDGRQWIRSEAWPLLGPERRLFIRMQWAIIQRLSPMIRSLDKRVERMGREMPAVALLRTIPGIGPYRALLIATETLPVPAQSATKRHNDDVVKVGARIGELVLHIIHITSPAGPGSGGGCGMSRSPPTGPRGNWPYPTNRSENAPRAISEHNGSSSRNPKL